MLYSTPLFNGFQISRFDLFCLETIRSARNNHCNFITVPHHVDTLPTSPATYQQSESVSGRGVSHATETSCYTKVPLPCQLLTVFSRERGSRTARRNT